MTTEESKQPEPSESGLGFRNLSMNEIAPATTAEASEVGARTSRTWLLAAGVLIAVAALVWLFQGAVDRLPAPQVQEQLRQRIAAQPYGQDGTFQGISFLSGNKARVDFSATISTLDQKGRDQLRGATQDIMKKLVEVRPDRDLFLTGFQRDEVVVEARYLHRSTLVTSSGNKVPDISIQVRDDPEGGISGSMGERKPGAGG